MFIVQFVANAFLWARFCHHKLHLANQAAAPRLVDPLAEFIFQRVELFLPSFAVGRDFQLAVAQADRARAGRQRLSDDRRPRG